MLKGIFSIPASRYKIFNMNSEEPYTARVKFPQYQAALLKMLREDQKELRSPEPNSEQTFIHCHRRACKMMEIIKNIKEPTIDNIGANGSQAVTILALHSYLKLMKHILALYEKQFQKDPASIYYQAIPSLKDRIMILEQRKQLFGTNWMVDEAGSQFLVTVQDFPHMNERRLKYGLESAR
jgi:hypothetical protein